ncbi:MAG: hypothetical protein KJ061_14950 [Vicinamibacteraceae bacterium]|nr:hypothetical protein [Vicinamibacteraceae bacterium]
MAEQLVARIPSDCGRLLLAVVIALCGAAGTVQAQTQTPGGSTDAYRTATRLGGSRSLYAACRPTRNQNCIRTQASLQRAMKNARFQKEVANAMDAAGLTGLTQRVIDAFASGEAKEISFEQGRTMEWMAYYNPKTRGADLIRMIKWGGRQPFGAYEVTIEEGPKTYTFVMPKPCGNLALASVVEAPVPECPTVNVQRDCDGKTLSFRVASPGQNISRIEVRREGSDQVVSVLRSENSFASGNLPMAGGRYTFKAFDQYGRETKMCQAVAVEECPVPKPVVVEPTCPPITMTATRVKGRYQVAIDASAARTAEVAPTLVLESVDAQVEQNGQMTQTIALDSNGQATVLLPKGTRPGTFRFRGKVSYDGRELNNKLYQGSRDCEYTVAIAEYRDSPSESELAEFWPPPRASAECTIPPKLLLSPAVPATLADVANVLVKALGAAGYRNKWSYLRVPNGFALIANIEQFRPDGTPAPSQTRWTRDLPSMRELSLIAFIKALVKSPPGHYRAIVFVVTDRPWPRSGREPSEREFDDVSQKGHSELPPSIGDTRYTPSFFTTALVYEFRKTSRRGRAVFIETSTLRAEEHLIGSGIEGALSGIR